MCPRMVLSLILPFSLAGCGGFAGQPMPHQGPVLTQDVSSMLAAKRLRRYDADRSGDLSKTEYVEYRFAETRFFGTPTPANIARVKADYARYFDCFDTNHNQALDLREFMLLGPLDLPTSPNPFAGLHVTKIGPLSASDQSFELVAEKPSTSIRIVFLVFPYLTRIVSVTVNGEKVANYSETWTLIGLGLEEAAVQSDDDRITEVVRTLEL